MQFAGKFAAKDTFNFEITMVENHLQLSIAGDPPRHPPRIPAVNIGRRLRIMSTSSPQLNE